MACRPVLSISKILFHNSALTRPSHFYTAQVLFPSSTTPSSIHISRHCEVCTFQADRSVICFICSPVATHAFAQHLTSKWARYLPHRVFQSSKSTASAPRARFAMSSHQPNKLMASPALSRLLEQSIPVISVCCKSRPGHRLHHSFTRSTTKCHSKNHTRRAPQNHFQEDILIILSEQD